MVSTQANLTAQWNWFTSQFPFGYRQFDGHFWPACRALNLMNRVSIESWRCTACENIKFIPLMALEPPQSAPNYSLLRILAVWRNNAVCRNERVAQEQGYDWAARVRSADVAAMAMCLCNRVAEKRCAVDTFSMRFAKSEHTLPAFPWLVRVERGPQNVLGPYQFSRIILQLIEIFRLRLNSLHWICQIIMISIALARLLRKAPETRRAVDRPTFYRRFAKSELTLPAFPWLVSVELGPQNALGPYEFSRIILQLIEISRLRPSSLHWMCQIIMISIALARLLCRAPETRRAVDGGCRYFL